MSKGDFAYTGNQTQVFIPDVHLSPAQSKPSYFAVPLRGQGYTLGVWDRDSDRFVGWLLAEDLGYKTAKEWMEHADLGPIRKFIDVFSPARSAEPKKWKTFAGHGDVFRFHKIVLSPHDLEEWGKSAQVRETARMDAAAMSARNYGEPVVITDPYQTRTMDVIVSPDSEFPLNADLREWNRRKKELEKARAIPGAKSTKPKQLGIPPSTRNFYLALTSKITQYDERLQKRQPNNYRLGHLLGAAQKVEGHLKATGHWDEDPITNDGIKEMKRALRTFYASHPVTGESDFPPAKAIIKQLTEYEATGKLPSLVR